LLELKTVNKTKIVKISGFYKFVGVNF